MSVPPSSPTRMSARIATAKAQILQLLAQEGVITSPMELHARLGERYFGDREDDNLHPHVLGLALSELIRSNDVVEHTVHSPRKIQTLQLSQVAPGGATRLSDTAQRKRRLLNTYLTWSSGTSDHPAVFGDAGELATRRALEPRMTVVDNRKSVHGVELNGSLDIKGIISPYDDEEKPVGSPFTVMCEVKNVRQWLFPDYSEVWQVIGKAAQVSAVHPEASILPVLVCRRAHPRTFWMAKHLGVYVVEAKAQFVGDTVPVEKVDEVRVGLGFRDLKAGAEPSAWLVKRLQQDLPKEAPRKISTWQKNVSDPRILELLLNAYPKNLSLLKRRTFLTELEDIFKSKGQPGWMQIRPAIKLTN